MFPPPAGSPTRSSAARSAAANRSRSSTRARGCGGRPATARRTSPLSARRWTPPRSRRWSIHAVYLINCATKDKELRKKSLTSLTHALRIGDGIGAAGRRPAPRRPERRAARPLDEAGGEGDRRGAEGQRHLPAAARADRRPQRPARPRLRPDRGADRAAPAAASGSASASTPATSSSRATTSPTRATSAAVLDEADDKVGLERLRCLHVNDAAAPLGSCRDRHANIGKGEMGKRGLAAFLSEPRFEGLPATLETPGPNKKGSDARK